MFAHDLSNIVETALKAAYQVYQQLGDEGRKLVRVKEKNQIALKADIEMEKAVIAVLRESRIPIRIISEEHGIVELSSNPTYLGILDGLDGTDAYKKNDSKERYGTMFGIYKGVDPKYRDYLIAGVMEHPTNRLFMAVNGQGSFEVISGKKIMTSGNTRLLADTPMYIDVEFDKNRDITLLQDTFLSKLKGHTNITHHISSAVHYVDLARGQVDLVMEATRKKNLEIAVAYGLVTEAGGAIFSLDGESLGEKKYLEFGQDEYLPVVSAATRRLTMELLQLVLAKN